MDARLRAATGRRPYTPEWSNLLWTDLDDDPMRRGLPVQRGDLLWGKKVLP
jgi:hypothetical protein